MALVTKICGLSTPATLEAALLAGADMVGFVFVTNSPRNVTIDEARALARQTGARARKVALLVDPDDAVLEAAVRAVDADMIQLHGKEPPERVAAIRIALGVPVIKAIGVTQRIDLAAITPYEGAADRILIDAKPPADADYPGGHGRPFDWAILDTLDPGLRFMLSGGLTAGNVEDAVRRVRPWGVDVSSGVERAPGVKDVEKIARFIAVARRAAGEEPVGM